MLILVSLLVALGLFLLLTPSRSPSGSMNATGRVLWDREATRRTVYRAEVRRNGKEPAAGTLRIWRNGGLLHVEQVSLRDDGGPRDQLAWAARFEAVTEGSPSTSVPLHRPSAR